jgi:hypothetical protein
MLAIGSALAGAGVLLVGLLALLFRYPRAPRWTRPEVVVFLTMVPVAGMIGIGLGLVLYGGNALLHGAGDLRELAVAVLVPVVVVLVWHALRIQPRLRAYADAGAGGPASVVPTPDVSLVGPTHQPPQLP